MIRCEIHRCRAEAGITHLGHGVCEEHWNQLTAEEASPDALRKALGIEAPTVLPMEETMAVPTAGTKRGKRTSRKRPPSKEGTAKKSRPKQEKASRESDVVFAFRLSEADRDRIHAASGSGGATRFVRTAALAAASADMKAFEELVAQARANLK